MLKNNLSLEKQICELLSDENYRAHPLFAPFDQLWRHYQDIAARIERIGMISDGSPGVIPQKKLSLSDQLDKQLRQMEKIARISDRYQNAMRDTNHTLKQASTLDELTGIPNRRYLVERCTQESNRSQRTGRPLSVAMLDLDYFKRINDAYGHASGDQVLVATARIMRGKLREHDICGRWGGEEFLFIFPDTDLASAARVIERVLDGIRHMAIPQKDHTLTITASAGVAQQHPLENYADAVHRADTALLRAKNSGRNQGVSCDD